LPDTPAAQGIIAAERVRQAIEALAIPFDNEPIRFTVSAGVVQFDPAQGGWESMMRRADTAMYEAKEHGRNAVWPTVSDRESEKLNGSPSTQSESLPPPATVTES
jgi:diguanylate cyclase (GGDEF)-like protein